MKIIYLLFAFLVFLTSAHSAYAHAFGQQYILPIPVSFYLYGCAVVLLVTFVMIGIFQKRPQKRKTEFILQVQNSNIQTILSFVFLLLNIFSTFFFFAAIVCGFIGTQEPTQNFSMTYFWIIFYLGITYISAIIGNFWEIVNPIKFLISVGSILKIFSYEGRKNYRLQYYPALFFYFLFIWFELVSKVTPLVLSSMLLIYMIYSVIIIYFFGVKNWTTYMDFFSVFYRLIGMIAPIVVDQTKILFRYPFSALIKERVTHISLFLFIIFMLASTAFDGFWETISWASIYAKWLLPVQNIFGSNGLIILKTICLFIFPLIFTGLFLLTVFCMKIIVKSKYTIGEFIKLFAYTLVPIGFVYNIAHYYTLLLFQGQAMQSLLSNPLGNGWNLLGTAGFKPNLQLVGTTTIWNFQVAAILFGHMVAVYLAHLVSLRIFPSQKNALLSQIPMLLLMVIYTIFGLWILSQPIRGFS